MKIKLLVDGNDGHQHLKAGEEYTVANEWSMRMLVNGLAAPLDEQAEAIFKAQPEQYVSAALRKKD